MSDHSGGYLGWFSAVIALVGATVLPAVGQSADAAEVKGQIVVAGETRTYTLAALPDGPKPLIVVLHGGGGWGIQVERWTGFAAAAQRHGMSAVFPDGIQRRWNVRGAQGYSGRTKPPQDIAFLAGLVRKLVADKAADPARVFVTGVSNGGMMTYRLACETDALFAGFGAVIANMPDGLAAACHPTGVRRMLIMNGTADPIMPFSGGEIRLFGMSRGAVISADATAAFWRVADGCDGTSPREIIARGAGADTASLDLSSATGCKPGADVAFYRMNGIGHQAPRPGSPRRLLLDKVLGPRSDAIDVAEIVSAYFERISRAP